MEFASTVCDFLLGMPLGDGFSANTLTVQDGLLNLLPSLGRLLLADAGHSIQDGIRSWPTARDLVEHLLDKSS